MTVVHVSRSALRRGSLRRSASVGHGLGGGYGGDVADLAAAWAGVYSGGGGRSSHVGLLVGLVDGEDIEATSPPLRKLEDTDMGIGVTV